MISDESVDRPDDDVAQAEWTAFFASEPPPPLDPRLAPTPGTGPVECLRLAWARRSEFEGRASRSEYWWLDLWVPVWLVLMFAAGVGLSLAVPSATFALLGLLMLSSLVVIWRLSWALTVRRLHDTGRDASWLWTWGLLPGTLIWVLLQRGDKEDNGYGPAA